MSTLMVGTQQGHKNNQNAKIKSIFKYKLSHNDWKNIADSQRDNYDMIGMNERLINKILKETRYMHVKTNE
jgi:hypothetical protein